ncbi:MAG: molybdopterin-dependent oxidoreductase [Actinobacteria bacterium]|nr:molybdopterin-dependent oxidoreductase [Actinomycetota bacterium]
MRLPAGKAPDLTAYQQTPLNVGAPLGRLADHLITPTPMVYVRNHAAVPHVDADRHRLQVRGLVRRPLELSLDILADRFERVELVAALSCAGNRRRELMQLADIPLEIPWGPDAIANVRWSGWRLRDLLAAAELSADVRHVALTGLDFVRHAHGRVEHFGGSIPLEKALRDEVLVVDRMNGEPLPPVHGFPLRLVVPGYIGARSVKWLAGVEACAEPSTNHFQQRAYRLFPPEVTGATVRWEHGTVLGELAINSVICRPADGDRAPAGPMRCEGYAVAGGGRRVERVELTSDGGRTWSEASRLHRSGTWGWTLWGGDRDLSPGNQEISVRAMDAAGKTQPEHPTSVWNFKGYVNNSWHRVNITTC